MAVYTPMDYAIGITILLAILALLYKFLFPRVCVDRYFAFALIPAIVFGIVVRVLADAGYYPKSDWWSVTPGIYLTACAFGTAYLSLSLYLEKKLKIEYWKISLAIGALVLPYFVLNLVQHMKSPLNVFYPFILAALLTSVVYTISLRNDKTRIFTKNDSAAIIFAHMLDASGTFIGIDFFGFSEEHILPEIFINLAGTALVMIPVKLVVVLLALYYLDKWREEGDEVLYRAIKLVFFILGFGPGSRNSLLLTLVDEKLNL